MVALRKESVDRNCLWGVTNGYAFLSLSARRAWIEIRIIAKEYDWDARRSPQGERG